jgi:SAM-dependent methyltransferase
MGGVVDSDCRAFKDHFSTGAREYARYRPTYPPALFEWLAGLCPARDLAWDCATGSGQAALGLAEHFERVIATDASDAQVEHAAPHPRVVYRVAPADASGLADRSVTLVTVAQALHWLDRPRFYAEVRRVTRPGGVLAVWTYNMLAIAPAIDALVGRFYRDTVGPWWAKDRALVEDGYRSIDFPFDELIAPTFSMRAEWTLADLEGYLRSWSAVQRYQAERGEDPVASLHAELAALWGEATERRTVRWPLACRAARIGRETEGRGTP